MGDLGAKEIIRGERENRTIWQEYKNTRTKTGDKKERDKFGGKNRRKINIRDRIYTLD